MFAQIIISLRNFYQNLNQSVCHSLNENRKEVMCLFGHKTLYLLEYDNRYGKAMRERRNLHLEMGINLTGSKAKPKPRVRLAVRVYFQLFIASFI